MKSFERCFTKSSTIYDGSLYEKLKLSIQKKWEEAACDCDGCTCFTCQDTQSLWQEGLSLLKDMPEEVAASRLKDGTIKDITVLEDDGAIECFSLEDYRNFRQQFGLKRGF